MVKWVVGCYFMGLSWDYGVYISAKTVAKHNNLALKFIAEEK